MRRWFASGSCRAGVLALLGLLITATAANAAPAPPPGWQVVVSDRACLLRTHALTADSTHPWRLHLGYVAARPGQMLLIVTHPQLRSLRLQRGTELGLIVNDRYFRGERALLRRGELVVPISDSGGLQRQLEQAEKIGVGVRAYRSARAAEWLSFSMGYIGSAAQWLRACRAGS